MDEDGGAVVELIDREEALRSLEGDKEALEIIKALPVKYQYQWNHACFNCGHWSVGWDNDYTFQDYGLVGDGIVHALHCSNCGALIEYFVSDDDEGEEDEQD